jgi:hypothetical protein
MAQMDFDNRNSHHGTVNRLHAAIKIACADEEGAMTKSALMPEETVFGRLFDAVPISDQPDELALRNLAKTMLDASGPCLSR